MQVGNFMSDRPSSRVLAAPGGASQISFGDAANEPTKKVLDLPSWSPLGSLTAQAAANWWRW